MIQDILPRYQEVANGSKTVFTFPFDVLRNEFIEVYVDSDKVTSGWTLSASEKTITFGVAPVAGKLVTIYRNIPIAWLNSVGTASSVSIDEAVTYLVAQIQTIKEGLSRAIQTRIVDTDKGEDLSDDYINSLGQATALYGECETLLAQIQVEGAAINALYEEFVERITNLISTDPNLTNPSDEVVPSQKAVKTYIDTKDSAVVHLTGNETITGLKNFTDVIYNTIGVNENRTGVTRFKNNKFALGTAPSTNINTQIQFRDKNDAFVGEVQHAYKSNGDVVMELVCEKQDSSTGIGISVGYKADGTAFSTCPTPVLPTNDSYYNSQTINMRGLLNRLRNEKNSLAPIELYPTSGSTVPYIDFHYNASSSDYTSRIREAFQNRLMIESAETILKSYGSGDGQLRIISIDDKYGMIFRNDGSNMWIFPTAQNDAYGTWSSTDKGIKINLSTGVVDLKGQYGNRGAGITDIGKSLAQKGYVCLSNGLIIQWGKSTTTDGTAKITLPKAFTSTNYAVVGNSTQALGNASNRYLTGWAQVIDRTTTNFTMYMSNFENSYWWNDTQKPFTWIAIGY